MEVNPVRTSFNTILMITGDKKLHNTNRLKSKTRASLNPIPRKLIKIIKLERQSTTLLHNSLMIHRLNSMWQRSRKTTSLKSLLKTK